jgi:hypothetical protein
VLAILIAARVHGKHEEVAGAQAARVGGAVRDLVLRAILVDADR